MVAYRSLYMLRQDYSQIDLFTPVRNGCLGKKLVLPAVGKLLTMGNWISHGWRNTEGWWENQSLLVTSPSNPSEFCFNLKLFFWPTSSALIDVAWPEAGNVLGKPRVGKQLCNEVIMVGQSANLVYYDEKFITLFFCLLFFVFTAYFAFTCLWNLISYCYLMGQLNFFFLNMWPQVVSFFSVTHIVWQMC